MAMTFPAKLLRGRFYFMLKINKGQAFAAQSMQLSAVL
jgi:hypothetical protein